MVTRTRGGVRQGMWFSADVGFVELTVSGGAFEADLTVTSTDPRQADVVNSGLEQVLEVFSTRGNVIALSVASATVLHVMVDYGQAFDPLAGSALGNQTAQDIEAELENAIIAITAPANVSTAAIVVEEGWVADALGTPS